MKSIIGKTVIIKLLDNTEYKGVLICLDGLMNIVLEQCEEITNSRKLGETYFRGNNVLYINTL